jgi:hypothetical protein
VLDPSLSKGDQSLLLLYSVSDWVDEKDLWRWVEYENLTLYRNRILIPYHNSRTLEYDKQSRRARLTTLGTNDVEGRLLPKYVR